MRDGAAPKKEPSPVTKDPPADEKPRRNLNNLLESWKTEEYESASIPKKDTVVAKVFAIKDIEFPFKDASK